MSNLIFWIMDTYNEKVKNCKNIQTRNKLWDNIKENKAMWLTYIILIISSICFVLFSFLKFEHSELYRLISFIAYIVLFLILIPMFEKSHQKNYKKNIAKYNLELKILRKILKREFKLYEFRKLEELIKQCDLIIDNFKFSKKIFKPLVNLTKSVVFPIVTFSFGLIVKKVDLSVQDIMIFTFVIILTVFMFLGIYYLVKSPVENYLDNTSNKVKSFKGILIDLYIQDFVEEKDV